MSSTSFTTEKREESVLGHKYKEHIKIIEDKTGVNGKYLVSALAGVGFLVFFGVFDGFLTNVVGTLLPGYLSLKSIESIETDVEKQWITYWVLYSAYGILDKISVLFIYYLPFYYFIKYLILIWLFMPNFNGAAQLYEAAIYNGFKKLEALIEKQKAKKKTSDAGETSALDQSKDKGNISGVSSSQTKSSPEVNSGAVDKKSSTPSKPNSDLTTEKKNI